MAENKNRKCAVCRQDYHFCPRCGEDKNKPTWYFTFCSSNCKDIYGVTSKFENGQLSADLAKIELDKLDLSKIDNFGDSYKNSIEKINAANVIEPIVEENAEENIEEVMVFEEAEPAQEIEEEKEIKKPRRAKRYVE